MGKGVPLIISIPLPFRLGSAVDARDQSQRVRTSREVDQQIEKNQFLIFILSSLTSSITPHPESLTPANRIQLHLVPIHP